MNDLEDRIAASLRAGAERSGAFEGLERAVVPRATRIRRHRRVAGVALAAAFAAAVVPLGVKVLPALPVNGFQPVGPTTSIAAGKAVTLPDDPGALPTGDSPKIPWFDGEYINDGSKRVQIGTDPILGFGRIAHGYWVQRGDGRIRLVSADGGTIGNLTSASPATAPVVSANGQRLAWTEADGTAVLAGTDGKELKRQRIREGIAPVGFLGEKVLLGDSERAAVLWDPSSGSTENLRLDVRMDSRATDSRDLVPIGTGGTCEGMYSFGREKILWTRCGAESINGFSADGRYTMLHSNTERSAALTDARTGRPLLRLENLTASPIRWASEAGGAVLIESEWNGRRAIVRCTIENARCELATELGKAGMEEERLPPYLATN